MRFFASLRMTQHSINEIYIDILSLLPGGADYVYDAVYLFFRHEILDAFKDFVAVHGDVEVFEFK